MFLDVRVTLKNRQRKGFCSQNNQILYSRSPQYCHEFSFKNRMLRRNINWLIDWFFSWTLLRLDWLGVIYGYSWSHVWNAIGITHWVWTGAPKYVTSCTAIFQVQHHLLQDVCRSLAAQLRWVTIETKWEKTHLLLSAVDDWLLLKFWRSCINSGIWINLFVLSVLRIIMKSCRCSKK